MRRNQFRWSVFALFVLATVATAAAQDQERGRHRKRTDGQDARPAERVKVEPARRRPPKDAQIVVFSLDHARVESVARVVVQMQRVFNEDVVACPDERTNKLVIAAESERAMNQIRNLIEALDTPSHDETAGEERQAVRLRHAEAKEVVVYLHRLAPDTPKLRFVADERANTIWLAGAADLVRDAAELVRQMEQGTEEAAQAEPADDREPRFYELKHANPWESANVIGMIAKWMDADVGAAVAGGANLVVFATPAQHDEVQKLITRLDVPVKRQVRSGPPAERRGRREHQREERPGE